MSSFGGSQMVGLPLSISRLRHRDRRSHDAIEAVTGKECAVRVDREAMEAISGAYDQRCKPRDSRISILRRFNSSRDPRLPSPPQPWSPQDTSGSVVTESSPRDHHGQEKNEDVPWVAFSTRSQRSLTQTLSQLWRRSFRHYPGTPVASARRAARL